MAWIGISGDQYINWGPQRKLRGIRLKKNGHCTEYHSFPAVKILTLGCCECQEVHMAVQVKGEGLDRFVEYKS